MTTLQDVAREARSGATAQTIAARLGASTDLVDAMLDELSRHALVSPAAPPGGSRCVSAPGASACSTTLRSPSCAGCPLASGQPGDATGRVPVRFLSWLGVRSGVSADPSSPTARTPGT